MSRPLSPGGGFAQGLSDVLGPIADERRKQRESARERQAELLEHNMEAIGANIAQAQSEMNALAADDPRRQEIQQQIEGYNQQHQKAAEAYHSLYGPQDLPGLLGRMRHWFDRKQVRGQNARPAPTPTDATQTAPAAPVDMNAPGMQQPADTIPARLPAANEPVGGEAPVTLPGTPQPAVPIPSAPAPKAPTPQPAQPRAAGSTAPAPSAPPMSERIPGTSATPPSALSAEQLRRNPAFAQTPEMSVAAAKRPAAATWTPVGEPYLSPDGKTVLQRERDPKSGAYRETNIPGPSPDDLLQQRIDRTMKQAKDLGLDENALRILKGTLLGIPAAALRTSTTQAHPLEAKFHPSTGGLYSLVDKDTDSEWTESNIKTAPPEIQRAWNDIKTSTEAELKRKSALEDKKEEERIAAEDRRFAKQLTLQANAFSDALKKSDYTAARKVIIDADNELQGATDRAKTMDQNLIRALGGDQQAMISLVANHIGMTLGAQKGARINQAVWDEAVQSTPWLSRVGAKFDSRGYLSGVTLAPDQMRQMVGLAHEKLDILKQHKERVEKEYQDAINVQPQTPADLKNKAKPKGGAAPATTADPLGILK